MNDPSRVDAASGPLLGLKVVDLSSFIAGCYTALRMGDLGADVVKVEPIEGDGARYWGPFLKGESRFFQGWNRSKRSIAVDLRSDAGREIVHALLRGADIVVENFRPGVTKKLLIDYETVRAFNPRAIYCSITGFGTKGPHGDRPAYDPILQSMSGAARGNVRYCGQTSIGSVAVCDYGAGLLGSTGILAALYHRERTGEGAAISVSMFDSMADWMAYHVLFHEYSDKLLPRSGLTHPMVCPYGVFSVKGGAQLLVAVQNEREWERFATQVLMRPEMLEQPQCRDNIARVENREQVEREINAVLSTLEREEVERRLRAAKIAYGAVNTVPELARHSQLRRVEVPSPGGPVSMPAPPVRFAGAEHSAGAIPALGEHSQAIRAEFEE